MQTTPDMSVKTYKERNLQPKSSWLPCDKSFKTNEEHNLQS